MRRAIKKQLALLNHGGERGIRTPDTELPYTRFPGVLLQPLGHLTAAATKLFSSAPSLERCSLYRNLTCMQAFFKKFLPEQWLQGCFLVKSCIYTAKVPWWRDYEVCAGERLRCLQASSCMRHQCRLHLCMETSVQGASCMAPVQGA